MVDDARWLGSGEAVEVRGHVIPGGLVYVGRHLNPVSSARAVEPALINPELTIDPSSSDWAGEKMTYWPSYRDAAPQCRTAYLRWLAAGRRDPTVGIGYVFLFFYGLERRLLWDATRVALPAGEREAIIGEVEGLLEIYGTQSSFGRYANEFLGAARIGAASRPASVEQPPSSRWGQYSLDLRVGLGRMSSEQRPIPPAWALAWLRAHPDTRLRTPAQRCASEFEQLFALRYRKAFGDGLVVKPSRTRITATYRPASASFEGPVVVPIGDLPDITALSAPVQKLREIAEGCVEDLEAYSRLLGREPEAKGSLAAIALLPAEVASTEGNAEATRLLQVVGDSLIDDDTALIAAAELLNPWPQSAGGKLTKSDGVLLSQFLQKRGYALEPDVRFGGPALEAGQKAVVFREAEPLQAPSAQYQAATLLLHLAAAVAQADGSVDRKEERHLSAHLEDALHLSDAERRRLSAHLQWLLVNDVGLTGLKKRLSALDATARGTIAQFLASVAGADGRIDRREIETLGKVYKLLGLEQSQLYGDLHALGASEGGDVGLVTAETAGAPAAGFGIPQGPSESQPFTLDVNRVNAKMKESAAASALLREIFVETEDAGGQAAANPTTAVNGLDGPHSTLLRTLSAKTSWPRAELEAHAASLKLMLDGALEVINERAFEVCGQPACEGDDPVEMNADAVSEVLR